MSRKQPEVNKKKLLQALEHSLGIVTPACAQVGISRDRFYTYYNEDPEFKKAVDDINEITLDFVENQLLRAIKEGDKQSIMFYMKYKARRRGYTDSVTIDANTQLSGGISITVKYENGDDTNSIEE